MPSNLIRDIPRKGNTMSVTLDKCVNGCKNKTAGDFQEGHRWYGETVCNWCAWMWGCDNQFESGIPSCFPKPRPTVSFTKLSDSSPFGGNHSEYTKTRDGGIPEYALSWRRRDMYGVRISPEQSYNLRANHPLALSAFFWGTCN